jgi:hypothetical protein
MRSDRHTGFSLLEVLLATTILLLSAVVLGELSGIGHMHIKDAEKLADAQWLAQAKLNEILSGVADAEAVDQQPLPEKAGWVYSVRIAPVRTAGLPAGLVALQVIVEEDLEADPDTRGTTRRGKRFTLTHWVHDPSLAQAGERELESLPSGEDSPLEEEALEEFFGGEQL